LQLSESGTVSSSAPRASGTSSDGRGRRAIQRTGATFRTPARSAYTWLTRSAIRTAANTEAKLLMLTHAFEVWQVLRVCFHTDARNQRSRAALERIGGQFEGILRAHRMAADFIPRDSVRYSILAAEWLAVKERLLQFVDRA
jgi:RimJ/RimL family protein N-acetyltransferase